MKDTQTVARPYAKALFELALKHQSLKQWNDFLSVLAVAIENVEMQKLLSHPEVTSAMLVEILVAVVKKMAISKPELELVTQALELMAGQHRLAVIPEVFAQYQALDADYAKKCSGTVFTSIQLDEKQLQRLEAGLNKKLNKTVHLTQVVQPTLLGGARVQIGDMVIDGTLRGRLQRFSQSLLA